VPIAPVIFKSKVAAVTDSSKAPMPVKVVFVPRVMESGVNEEILAWVAPAPQSDHVSFKSVAAAVETMRATEADFMTSTTRRK